MPTAEIVIISVVWYLYFFGWAAYVARVMGRRHRRAL